ncbi:hypothetical protein [Geomicrobium sp. JCM 19055]|nr:hypothetical protein [Geomicrobium sp. JCM 19055]
MIKYPAPTLEKRLAASRMETRFSGYRAANRYVERERKEAG